MSTQSSLQSARDARKKAQDDAWADAVRLATEQKNDTAAQAEQLASEAYVGKKQQERTLPGVMAASGLSGTGYTETTANNINTAFQNAWNDIMTNKQKTIGGIDSNLASQQSAINQNKANIDADYYDALASYYASIQRSSGNGGNNTTNKNTSPLPIDVSGLNNEQMASSLVTEFTNARYRTNFWGQQPGMDATIAQIQQMATSATGLKGARLSPAEIQNILTRIKQYWLQQQVAQRSNPGSANTGATLGAGTPGRSNRQTSQAVMGGGYNPTQTAPTTRRVN